MTRAERKARTERLNAVRAETVAVVLTGKCPRCASALRRNLALSGWWQCEQYGDGPYRARPGEAQCGWQGFTS